MLVRVDNHVLMDGDVRFRLREVARSLCWYFPYPDVSIDHRAVMASLILFTCSRPSHNIILPSAITSSKWSLYFEFPNKHFICSWALKSENSGRNSDALRFPQGLGHAVLLNAIFPPRLARLLFILLCETCLFCKLHWMFKSRRM